MNSTSHSRINRYAANSVLDSALIACKCGLLWKMASSIPLYSVLSVFLVVIADKLTTDYTENTEKTRTKKAKMSDTSVKADTRAWSLVQPILEVQFAA